MKKLVVPVCIALAFIACKKESPTEEIISRNYSLGVYVGNEGAFLSNNASLTHIGEDGSIQADAFSSQNSSVLGDVLQSVNISGQTLYAVLNNSQKVEAVNINDLSRKGVIEGSALDYPRQVIQHDGTVYISNGSLSGSVVLADASTLEITGSIPVGYGPESFQLVGDQLWVANSGGWGLDSTISVIDFNSNNLVSTINLTDRPMAMNSTEEFVFVLCSGQTLYDQDWNITGHTPAFIHQVQKESYEILSSTMVGLSGDHPVSMDISPDGETLYVVNDHVLSWSVSDMNSEPTVLTPGGLRSVSVSPDGSLWCAETGDYVSNNVVYHYSDSGEEIASYVCGIAPIDIAFP